MRLSSSWTLQSVDQLVTLRRGGYWGAGVSDSKRRRSVQVVRNGDIPASPGPLTGSVPRYFSDKEAERASILPGDVLMTTSGKVGKVHLASTDDLWASNFVRILRPDPAMVVPKYLLYSLLLDDVRAAMGRHIGGSTIQNLRGGFFEEAVIPVAPLPEQRRIVEAIEVQFSRLDAAEEALRNAHQRALRMKKAVLISRTVGWPERQIGEFAEVYVGATPSRRRPELWGGPIPWVSSGEVAFNRIRSTRETVSEEAVRPERIHPPGTVMLAMIGEGKTRGQAAILDVAATHNQNCAALRLDVSVALPEWVFYVLMSRYEETRRAGSGGNQPALNSDRIKAMYLPLPPLHDQARFVAEIDLSLSVLDKTTDSLPVALRRVEELRRAVLREAVAGRLVPQDPSDEPVSDLLEKVKA